jgi:hypothetical protein
MRSGGAGFHDSVGRYFSPPYVRGNEAIPNSAASKTAILVIFIFIIHGFRDGGAAVDIQPNSSSLGRSIWPASRCGSRRISKTTPDVRLQQGASGKFSSRVLALSRM